MSNSDVIAKNTVFLYLRSFFVLLISLYTSRVVLRVLGVEDYGIYNVVGGIVGVLSFLNTSMAATYQRYFNYEMGRQDNAKLTSLFRSSITVQFFYSLIIVAVAEIVGLWLIYNYLIIPQARIGAAFVVYQVSVIAFILTTFQAPFNALIIAYEKMGIFAAVSILDAVLKLLIVYLLQILPFDKLISYSILSLSISVVNTLIYVYVCNVKFEVCEISLNLDRDNFKTLLSFSSWGLIDSLSYTLNNQGINILLNIFFGPVVNAARGIAYQVLNAVNQFVTSFQTSFRPQLTKCYSAGDYTAMYRLYYSATKLSFYLLWVLSLPIIVETSAILHLWLGENVPDYTIAFTRLSLFTALVNTYANPTTCIAYATGKIKWFTIIVSGFNLLILPVAFVFLKIGYDAESSMLICLLFSIIVQFVRILVIRTILPFSIKAYLFKVITPTIFVMLASFVPPIICKVLCPRNLLVIILDVGISILSVLSFIWLFGLSKSEKEFARAKFNTLRNNNQ